MIKYVNYRGKTMKPIYVWLFVCSSCSGQLFLDHLVWKYKLRVLLFSKTSTLMHLFQLVFLSLCIICILFADLYVMFQQFHLLLPNIYFIIHLFYSVPFYVHTFLCSLKKGTVKYVKVYFNEVNFNKLSF